MMIADDFEFLSPLKALKIRPVVRRAKPPIQKSPAYTYKKDGLLTKEENGKRHGNPPCLFLLTSPSPQTKRIPFGFQGAVMPHGFPLVPASAYALHTRQAYSTKIVIQHAKKSNIPT